MDFINQLKERTEEYQIYRYVSRSTLSGGVFSPLLWNFIISTLLTQTVWGRGKAYADPTAIAHSGKFPQILCDLTTPLRQRGIVPCQLKQSRTGAIYKKTQDPRYQLPVLHGIQFEKTAIALKCSREGQKALDFPIDLHFSSKTNVAIVWWSAINEASNANLIIGFKDVYHRCTKEHAK